jgi:hypothetical protein
MAIPVGMALVWNWFLASAGAYKNHAASTLSGSRWLDVMDSESVDFATTMKSWGQTCFFFGGGELHYNSFPGNPSPNPDPNPDPYPNPDLQQVS